jgi:hypothetical protein
MKWVQLYAIQTAINVNESEIWKDENGVAE